MSIRTRLEGLSDEYRLLLAKELEFSPKATIYGPSRVSVFAFDIQEEEILIPMNFGVKKLKLSRPPRSHFPRTNLKFNGTLRSLQKAVKKEAFKLLNSCGSCIISLYTGGGKTATAINMAIGMRMPTLIILSRLVLYDQWVSSIKKFCPEAKIQKVTSKSKCDTLAHFYIVNAINVPKLEKGFFSKVGTLIVDELHLIGTEKLSASLYHVCPRYSIGLSATPTRPDGMDKLLYAYFGKEQVYRKLFREHIVYKISTGFKPLVQSTASGNLDWNSILTSQAESEERNDIIIRLVEKFTDRSFLILCKRVSQAKYLEEKFLDRSISVTSLIGVKRTFDSESRVLVATVQKVGVGFDHPRLNTLLIAGDLQEYFLQYLGRVFRTEEGVPVIFDLVDSFGVLNRHYLERRRVYLDHGGRIKSFKKEYPGFKLNLKNLSQDKK